MTDIGESNAPGRHVPSILTAMVVLQIALIVTSTDAKKLPSPRAELGIAFSGFILLMLSRPLPQVASKLAWLIVTAAIFANVTSKTPVVQTLSGSTKAPQTSAPLPKPATAGAAPKS
jgi:hypothetical protein